MKEKERRGDPPARRRVVKIGALSGLMDIGASAPTTIA
jgi:hypothetical protein